ncbi:hypothetical protein Tco_0287171, partial [Tanacetum coccineum]
YGKGSGIGGYGDCDGYLGESSRGDAGRFGSGDEHDLYRGSKIRAGGGPDSGPAASYGGSYGSGAMADPGIQNMCGTNFFYPKF